MRNRRDGSVEAFIQGETGAMATLIAEAHAGPAHADVAAIDVAGTSRDLEDVRQAGFVVLPTV